MCLWGDPCRRVLRCSGLVEAVGVGPMSAGRPEVGLIRFHRRFAVRVGPSGRPEKPVPAKRRSRVLSRVNSASLRYSLRNCPGKFGQTRGTGPALGQGIRADDAYTILKRRCLETLHEEAQRLAGGIWIAAAGQMIGR